MDKESFIKKANEVHGNKYNYDLLPDVFKMTDRVKIVCDLHGEFEQIARNHTHAKHGCPICGRIKANKKITDTFEEFLEKEKKVHGDKYEAIRESFTATKDKVKIRCKKCGNIFEQTGTMHLYGNGCSFCHPAPKKLTTEKFKEKLAKTHPNLEVLTEYISTNKPITVRCKIHNHTYTTTPHRLVQGSNCQKCYDDRRGKTILKPIEKVIEDLHKVHGDKYEYPKINEEYENSKSKLTVICNEGHVFISTINKLLSGHGCNKCADIKNGISKRLTPQEVLSRSMKKHKSKYLYPKINEEYTGYNSKITIICPVHGEFKQISGIHMSGCGCPSCNESHLERDISILFPDAERYKKFKWLGKQSLDFYISKNKIGIECQGSQHFEPSEGFGGYTNFLKCLERDIRKNRLCREHGVKLIYIMSKKHNSLLKHNTVLQALYDDNVYFIEDLNEGIVNIKDIINDLTND